MEIKITNDLIRKIKKVNKEFKRIDNNLLKNYVVHAVTNHNNRVHQVQIGKEKFLAYDFIKGNKIVNGRGRANYRIVRNVIDDFYGLAEHTNTGAYKLIA